MKKAWDLIGKLTNTKKVTEKTTVTSVVYQGNTTSDNFRIANAFNEYFTTIGNKLAGQINHNGNINMFLDKPVPHTIYLTPVTDTEIINEINKLKPGKAAGIDAIPSKLLKAAPSAIAPSLTHIFNRVFATGTYPESLKISKVIPIYKKGDCTLPENYRPISLLSCINRLLEKVIETSLTHMTYFMITNLDSGKSILLVMHY